ncbi:MAG: YebC/PmpR family DNA-binding transcriptional regulator [Planctomycetota bacterium]|nr:YebC/PmpR family DNA-binding transcriptional regulator [Planctomycetota bacterium]
MAGHSHWAGIKHKKGIADKKKGKVFSKWAKQIISAARKGGGDPSMNLHLKYAIEKARASNMPKDKIERAIKKGTGELEGGDLTELLYEGYGPGGVAILAEILTDSRNRTFSEIKKIFEKRGGNIGATGCVAWMFESKGFITVEEGSIGEDDLMELAIEAGATDLETESGLFQITTEPLLFDKVKGFLEEKGIKLQGAEITRIPKSYVPLDASTGKKTLSLLDELEDHEDVQNVHANFDLPDDSGAEG